MANLSQLKPGKGFVEVFGERPYRPDPGEALLDMRGRQVAYQQLIRDWEDVQPAEAPLGVAAVLEAYSHGIGEAKVFTSSQRPGLWCRFPGIPARRYDIHSLDKGASLAIIAAQASYMEHVGSLPPDKVFPTPPGLVAINQAKLDEEAAALEAAAAEGE